MLQNGTFFLTNVPKGHILVTMTKDDYWKRVQRGAQKLGIPDATYRKWRSRGVVSRAKLILLYEQSKGTPDEIPLSFPDGFQISEAQ